MSANGLYRIRRAKRSIGLDACQFARHLENIMATSGMWVSERGGKCRQTESIGSDGDGLF